MRSRGTPSARWLMAMQSLDQENPPFASLVREFAGSGSICVVRMRDLADALEMGLGVPLVVTAAILAAVHAGSSPGIHLIPFDSLSAAPRR